MIFFTEYVKVNKEERMKKITVAKGDGIGPEIMEAVLNIFKAASNEPLYTLSA